MWEVVTENACHSLNESQCSAVEHASCMQVMAKGHALYLSILQSPSAQSGVLPHRDGEGDEQKEYEGEGES